MKYFLRKNEKNIEVNKAAGSERLPYFSLFEIIDREGDKAEFKEVAAFWRAKSGKGYSGVSSKPFVKPEPVNSVETKEDIPWD